MGETRRHLVVEVFVVSCLAAALCRGLSTSIKEESAPQRSIIKHERVVDTPASWRKSIGGARGKDLGYDVIHPPKHVMKLMQRLSQDQDLLKERGNTVRSYLPTLRFACSEPTYVFTIRPHQSENLRSVEFHFFAPKSTTVIGSRLTIDIHLHLITNTLSACQPIGVQQRPAGARGWQVVDLTPQISQLINTSTGSEASKITLGVSFRVQMIAGSHDTSRDSSTIEKIVSNHARPFLLMYAQDDGSKNKNSVFPWTEDASKPTVEHSHSRLARSVDNKAQPIMTNEFPEGSTNLGHQATFQHFTEQDSKRRKSKKRTSKRRKGASKKHGKAPLLDQSSSAIDDGPLDTGVIIGDRDQNTVLPEEPSQGACSRHPMFVGFDTIDWDRYVIAPTGFDAFYCAGDCSFPLYKTGNPSNHATIQSVMSVAGVQPKIPSPCCVPETLSSITILFFNEDDNLELKTYQNMVVESCGCR